MEENNKYWAADRVCVFCERGRDKMSHFIEECEIT